MTRKPVAFKWTKDRKAALLAIKDAPRSAIHRRCAELGITLRCLDEDAMASALDSRAKDLDAKERFLQQQERDLWKGLQALQTLEDLATFGSSPQEQGCVP